MGPITQTHFSHLGSGGLHEVVDLEERNDITVTDSGEQIAGNLYSSARRQVGMLVHVYGIEEPTIYKLIPEGYWGNGGTKGYADWGGVKRTPKELPTRFVQNIQGEGWAQIRCRTQRRNCPVRRFEWGREYQNRRTSERPSTRRQKQVLGKTRTRRRHNPICKRGSKQARGVDVGRPNRGKQEILLQYTEIKSSSIQNST